MPELIINPIQKQAIESAAGAMQVLAGPGSGKTFVITQRIRYLIEKCGADPSSILVITFTKAAAKEMRQRFLKLMDDAMPLVNFGTFHAVFYHILRQTGKYRNFTLISETDKRKILSRLLNLPPSGIFLNDERIDSLLKYISIIKNNGGDVSSCIQDAFSEDELKRYYHEYNGYLTELCRLDFDDMGLLCLELFEKNPKILLQWQNKYRYIMVDEFQDINSMQYQIVKYIAGENANLFIVGDDDQSIYGFRGARPDIMHQFMEDYTDARQLLLNVNYRCHEDIVAKSLQVIDMNKNRYHKEISASHAEGEGLIMKAYPDIETEYEELIKGLKAVKESGDIKALSDTAVIYRTNYECSLLAEKLLLNDIPFVMKETLKSRYESFVIKDILAYMEFADGNTSRELFHLIMNRPLRYLKKDCARGERITQKEVLDYYKDNKSMRETAEQMFHDLAFIKTMKPYTAINYIRKVIGYDAYLKENYTADIFEKHMQTADDFQMLAKGYGSFKELNDYVGQCVMLARNKQNEKGKNEENANMQEGIQLMTMHASKGLEFDSVILPDVNEGKIPPKKTDTTEAAEEERRMFYVAMTRAKKNLYILYCSQKDGKDTPSRFLEPILKDH